MCVSVWVCMCVCVCVCVCVRIVSLVIRHANRLPHATLSPVACLTLRVSTLSYNGCDFRKHVTEHKMCFDFTYKFNPERFSFQD